MSQPENLKGLPARPTVLSCFSGVGGMDLGLEAAGFLHVGLIEKDERARAALQRNRDHWPLLDVKDVLSAGVSLTPKDVGIDRGELTLLAGAPPCQPFSMAAQWEKPRQGVTDDRGQAIHGMLDLIERFLPRAVIMENVTGFFAGKNSARPLIEARLNAINFAHGTQYRLQAWKLNAADFGVAQSRLRVIAVAFRDPLPASQVLPLVGSFSADRRSAWDAIGHLSVDEDLDTLPSGRYKDLLPSIPEGKNYLHLTSRGGGSSVELFGYRTRYWSFLLKLRKDAPAWTLPASPGPSTGPFHWKDRHLTHLEALALQGLPVSWELPGSPRTRRWLVGNATPTPLAESVGLYVQHILQGNLAPSALQTVASTATPSSPEGPPPPANSPRPLPPQWQDQVGPRSAHLGAGRGPAGHAVAE